MAARAQKVTLVASTPQTLNLTDTLVSRVMVTNHGPTNVVYVRSDGTNPTVAGDEAHVVLVGQARELRVFDLDTTAVRLISAGTPVVTVEAL